MEPEYIEREALLEHTEYDNNYRLIIPAEAINGAPAADVAPVVRCKDCRYAGVHVVDDTHEIVGHWCGLLDIDNVSDDDFCSFGKRKENENDA